MNMKTIAEFSFGGMKIIFNILTDIKSKSHFYTITIDEVNRPDRFHRTVEFKEMQLLINMLNKCAYKRDSSETVYKKVLHYLVTGEYNDEDLFSTISND